MCPNKKVNVKLAVAATIVALACCIAVLAMLDYTVVSFVNNPYVASPARTAFNDAYWTWLAAAMLAFGFFGAVLVKLALPGRPVGTRLAVAVFFSTVVMVVGNLEDCLYFILGQRSFPAMNTSWNWMIQYSIFVQQFHILSNWTTISQLIWSCVWLLLVLPVGLVAIFKFPQRKR